MNEKQYDNLQGFNPTDIELTDCKGNLVPVFLEKHDTLTVTVCGTGKTPLPKKAIYIMENNVLKLVE